MFVMTAASTLIKSLYGVYGLPSVYLDVKYSDTQLLKVKQDALEKKIPTAPAPGTLVIHGTAAPVVNQLLELGRAVRGIDFAERSSKAFESHQNVTAEVVVLLNVGSEVSLNGKVSGLVLRNLLKFYSNRKTLVIMETHMTKKELFERYDYTPINFMKILPKEEKAWV